MFFGPQLHLVLPSFTEFQILFFEYILVTLCFDRVLLSFFKF